MMMRRLMSWCVPDKALRLSDQRFQKVAADPQPDLTNVERVLKPYKEELEVGGYHAASIYTKS